MGDAAYIHAATAGAAVTMGDFLLAAAPIVFGVLGIRVGFAMMMNVIALLAAWKKTAFEGMGNDEDYDVANDSAYDGTSWSSPSNPNTEESFLGHDTFESQASDRQVFGHTGNDEEFDEAGTW